MKPSKIFLLFASIYALTLPVTQAKTADLDARYRYRVVQSVPAAKGAETRTVYLSVASPKELETPRKVRVTARGETRPYLYEGRESDGDYGYWAKIPGSAEQVTIYLNPRFDGEEAQEASLDAVLEQEASLKVEGAERSVPLEVQMVPGSKKAVPGSGVATFRVEQGQVRMSHAFGARSGGGQAKAQFQGLPEGAHAANITGGTLNGSPLSGVWDLAQSSRGEVVVPVAGNVTFGADYSGDLYQVKAGPVSANVQKDHCGYRYDDKAGVAYRKERALVRKQIVAPCQVTQDKTPYKTATATETRQITVDCENSSCTKTKDKWTGSEKTLRKYRNSGRWKCSSSTQCTVSETRGFGEKEVTRTRKTTKRKVVTAAYNNKEWDTNPYGGNIIEGGLEYKVGDFGWLDTGCRFYGKWRHSGKYWYHPWDYRGTNPPFGNGWYIIPTKIGGREKQVFQHIERVVDAGRYPGKAFFVFQGSCKVKTDVTTTEKYTANVTGKKIKGCYERERTFTCKPQSPF